MKFDLVVVPNPPLSMVPELTRRADEYGFDGLWFDEAHRTPFPLLSVAAFNTERLDLGTCVTLALPRSPMVTAQDAWAMTELIGPRFRLGLGTQVASHLERRFSVPGDRLGPRLREYVLALRAIFRAFQGEELSFAGRFWSFDLLPEIMVPDPVDHPDVPIYVAAVRPWMARMAGEVADGVHVAPFHTTRYLEDVLYPAVWEGAARAGRDGRAIEMVCPAPVLVGEPDELDQLREQARMWIAFYCSTGVFDQLFQLHGWDDVAARLTAVDDFAFEDAAGVAAHVTDEMVDALTVTTTWDKVASVLHQRYAGLADRLLVYRPCERWVNDWTWLERWSDVGTELRAYTGKR